MTFYDFRSPAKADNEADVIVSELTNPFAVFQAKENTEQDAYGLHMWCRGGAGAGIMLREPSPYGMWRVRMRISAGKLVQTTKVCLLLWPAGTGWPPEIDFNESGDRSRSNQTLHYSSANLMRHTTYPVDQTKWHTYGVLVEPDRITYFCDDQMRTMIANEAPGTNWNVHLRTQPNLDTESETVMDVRWLDVP